MVYVYIFVMALVTYLIRVIPLTLFQKKIENRFVQSFLYYMPYACLTAMTFPAILYATHSIYSAIAGICAAVVPAFFEKSLLTVAACACAAVFIAEQLAAIL